MGDAEAGAALCDVGDVVLDFGGVCVADVVANGVDGGVGGFAVGELHGAAPWEGDFGMVEDLEEDDVVAAKAELFEGGLDGFGFVEEVGHDDEEATMANECVGCLAGGGEVGSRAGLDAGELSNDASELAGVGAWFDVGLEAIVEGEQADAVLLAEEEVGDGGGEGDAVFEFGHGGALVAVAHGFADVDKEGAVEVCLGLVFFDVEALCFGEGVPVDGLGFVADDVFAVFGEFGAEAMEWAAVEAGEEAFDDALCLEVEVCDGAQGLGLEVLCEVGGHVIGARILAGRGRGRCRFRGVRRAWQR